MPDTSLADILNSWRDWDTTLNAAPIVVAKIGSGRLNQCWEVTSEAARFVLRISSPLLDNIGCNWDQELKVSSLAPDLGISPRLVFSNPNLRVMIFQYWGAPLDDSFRANKNDLNHLAKRLKTLHQTTAELSQPGYLNTIREYWQLIGRQQAESELEQEMIDFARQLDADTNALVFCHHDLSNGNVLTQGGEFQFIDWEYARLGHALYDLASLCRLLRLNREHTETLFRFYGAPRYFNELLQPMLQFIDYLDALWIPAISAVQGHSDESLNH